MLMEAKYVEITLVMHFKCNIGGKGENSGLKHPTELWFPIPKYSGMREVPGSLPGASTNLSFRLPATLREGRVSCRLILGCLKHPTELCYREQIFFGLLCLWRQNTLKSSWLCISSAILGEKGKTQA